LYCAAFAAWSKLDGLRLEGGILCQVCLIVCLYEWMDV
jgi:hypothetical protein